MNGFKRKLRRLVHDLYYWKAGRSRVQFALKCRDVVGDIDAKAHPGAPGFAARTKLHLAICQACNDYARTSAALGSALRRAAHGRSEKLDQRRLVDSLTLKFSRPRKGPERR